MTLKLFPFFCIITRVLACNARHRVLLFVFWLIQKLWKKMRPRALKIENNIYWEKCAAWSHSVCYLSGLTFRCTDFFQIAKNLSNFFHPKWIGPFPSGYRSQTICPKVMRTRKNVQLGPKIICESHGNDITYSLLHIFAKKNPFILNGKSKKKGFFLTAPSSPYFHLETSFKL